MHKYDAWTRHSNSICESLEDTGRVPDSPPIGVHRKGVRVLIVDDHFDTAASMGQLLTLLGHEARCSDQPERGLELLQGWSPQVALIDVHMSRMDGFEFARKLREIVQSRIVLVAMTGFTRAREKAESIAAGFQDHLVKPFELDKLLQILDEV
jgi:CheY-like chemotaxis protein